MRGDRDEAHVTVCVAVGFVETTDGQKTSELAVSTWARRGGPVVMGTQGDIIREECDILWVRFREAMATLDRVMWLRKLGTFGETSAR